MFSERIITTYALGWVFVLLLGVCLGHAITIRSWVTWWETIEAVLLETVRRVIREELKRTAPLRGADRLYHKNSNLSNGGDNDS